MLGDEAPHPGTMQGTYIFAPDGTLLARRNTNSAEAVLELMRGALARLETHAAPATPPALPAPRGRWEDSYPEEGLALRRWVRDLPADLDPAAPRAVRFNRDAVWFSAQEMRAFIPATLEPGARARLPEPLADRLARLVFVDNARGQTLPFAPAEIRKARFESELVSVTDDRLTLELEGSTEAVAPGPWLLGENDWKPAGLWPHALRTTMRGRATWDRRRERFVAFDLLALGRREGRTVNNGRGRDDSPGPIGFVLELAPPDWRVAPTYADLYDVAWMRHPESPRGAREKSFSLLCSFRTKTATEDFPLLVANKAWAAGEVRDRTDHHHLGRSRTSGLAPGFALALQPNGAWCWNLGDGRQRLDHLPPATRQAVDDGALHHLAFTVDRERNEARLYRDGAVAAIYSIAGLGALRPETAELRLGEGVLAVDLRDGVLSPEEIRRAGAGAEDPGPTPSAPPTPAPPERIKVLAWNIWHGGRRDGNALGLAKTIDVIRASGADVVCMQETYGSGAAIADALGFHLYLRSSNLSVMSRFPVLETHDLFEPFRLGGVTLDLGSGRRLKVFSLWINSAPDIGAQMRAESVSAESLLAAEKATRGAEIERLLHTLEPHLRPFDPTPVIVAGDFNSPSHLDWTEATRDRHRDLVVPWPVSRAMYRQGFRDAFRIVHPDARARPARTWSPRFADDYPQRIDHVYFRGEGLVPRAAEMRDRHPEGWPSDHAAVLVEFEVVAPKER